MQNLFHDDTFGGEKYIVFGSRMCEGLSEVIFCCVGKHFLGTQCCQRTQIKIIVFFCISHL